MKNLIRNNVGEGIVVQSADPFIYNNRIEFNTENGIQTYTFNNIRCDGQIKNNDINGNLKNGVYITGRNNKTMVI
jgi:hypothetical protein